MYVNELNQFHPHDGLVNDMADTLHFQPRGYKYDTPISGKLYSDVTGSGENYKLIDLLFLVLIHNRRSPYFIKEYFMGRIMNLFVN